MHSMAGHVCVIQAEVMYGKMGSGSGREPFRHGEDSGSTTSTFEGCPVATPWSAHQLGTAMIFRLIDRRFRVH